MGRDDKSMWTGEWSLSSCQNNAILEADNSKHLSIVCSRVDGKRPKMEKGAGLLTPWSTNRDLNKEQEFQSKLQSNMKTVGWGNEYKPDRFGTSKKETLRRILVFVLGQTVKSKRKRHSLCRICKSGKGKGDFRCSAWLTERGEWVVQSPGNFPVWGATKIALNVSNSQFFLAHLWQLDRSRLPDLFVRAPNDSNV